MDQQVNDMLTVLSINDSILELYNVLADIEKEGKLEEYKDICEGIYDSIRSKKKRVKSYILSYPLNDAYIEKFKDALIELDKTDLYYYEYESYLNKYRHRRLLEMLYEFSLLFHTKPIEEEIHGKVIIDDTEYDLNDDLEELQDYGFDVSTITSNSRFIEDNDKFNKDIDDYDYASIQLETNIFMNYLIDAIEKEEDIEIKNRLIDVKYNILSTISCLEDSFLAYNRIKNSIDHYHTKLDFIFRRNRELYPEFLDEHTKQIQAVQEKIIDRNKSKYNNIDEKVNDILVGLSIKTHLSCIPDESLRESIVDDQKVAMELSKTTIDRKVLKKSLQLNKNYVINNNYN